MLDVEFLITPPAASRTIIYVYRTGALRWAMREALYATAAGEGRQANLCEPIELGACLRLDPLFTPTPYSVCDWSGAIPPKHTKRSLNKLLQTFANRARDHFALFVRANSALTRQPALDLACAAGLLVEEPPITADTLLPALRYFEATTDLAQQPALIAQQGFVSRFADALDDLPDLPTLRRAFDDCVLMATDRLTDRYTPAHDPGRHFTERGHASLTERLRALIAGTDGWDAVRLTLALDELRWRRGRAPLAVVADIYVATTRALQDGTRDAVPSRRRRVRTLDALLWASLLLSAEAELVADASAASSRARASAASATARYDGLGREFRFRRGMETGGDRLAGRWSDLESLFHIPLADVSITLRPARVALIRAMDQALGLIPNRGRVPWLARLQRGLIPALAALPVGGDTPVDDETFDDEPARETASDGAGAGGSAASAFRKGAQS